MIRSVGRSITQVGTNTESVCDIVLYRLFIDNHMIDENYEKVEMRGFRK